MVWLGTGWPSAHERVVGHGGGMDADRARCSAAARTVFTRGGLDGSRPKTSATSV